MKGKFVSPNAINLSTRILPKTEISLSSKGLKFIPTPTSVNEALIKEELECFDRKLRILWHIRNEEYTTVSNPFKKEYTFDPKVKDVTMSFIYAGWNSRLQRLILNHHTPIRLGLYSLRDATSTIIKVAVKG